MYSSKELVLASISMKDVLNKYGIKNNRYMFCCPFHNDKTPSAKIYDKSFHCFACQTGGDLIQFVESYFNLSFVEAIQKINEDFNLGIDLHKKTDERKLEMIRAEQLLKKIEKQQEIREKRKKLIELCNLSQALKKTYKKLKGNINPYNWEETEYICSRIEEEMQMLDIEFDKLNIKQ